MVSVEETPLMNITYPTDEDDIVVQFAGDADVEIDDFRDEFTEEVHELADSEPTVKDRM